MAQNLGFYRRPQYSLNSVDHALLALHILRDTGRAKVSEVARDLGTSSSTAHRLLAMLVYRGFAVQNEDRTYSPGPALGVEPANTPWTRRLKDLLLPRQEQLAQELGESVNLMFRVGRTVRFLCSVEPATPTTAIDNRTGIVLDARRASGGKVLLAELPPAELYRLYAPQADSRERDPELAGLLRRLEEVRRRGYALNENETENGLCALGIALHDTNGAPIASISVSVPAYRAAVLTETSTLDPARGAVADMEGELAAVGFVGGTSHGFT